MPIWGYSGAWARLPSKPPPTSRQCPLQLSLAWDPWGAPLQKIRLSEGISQKHSGALRQNPSLNLPGPPASQNEVWPGTLLILKPFPEPPPPPPGETSTRQVGQSGACRLSIIMMTSQPSPVVVAISQAGASRALSRFPEGGPGGGLGSGSNTAATWAVPNKESPPTKSKKNHTAQKRRCHRAINLCKPRNRLGGRLHCCRLLLTNLDGEGGALCYAAMSRHP